MVVPLADPAALWPAMHTAFRGAVEAVPTPVDGSAPPTRVAVIDDRREVLAGGSANAPAIDLGPDGRPRHAVHGLVLRHLISELTCDPDVGRAAELFSHQALDVVTDASGGLEVDPFAGHFGYHSRLAEAIWEAWRDWRFPSVGPSAKAEAEAAAGANLIMNLSVGWEPRYGFVGGDPAAGETPVVEAIRLLLEIAACDGALIFAAAGNDPGGTADGGASPAHDAPHGPMFPARWEEVELPAACQPPMVVGAPPYMPLLHAVGGVDRDDVPIVISRPGSLPRLVAPAFWGITRPPAACVSADQPLALERQLTGTSVATSVVSALAAVLWHHEPGLRAEEVADVIHASGAELAAEADWCGPFAGAACPPIRRASLCPALMAAGLLPAGASCDPPGDPWTGVEAAFVDPDGAIAPTAIDLTAEREVLACGVTLRTETCDDVVEDPCPGRQAFNGRATPWLIEPQPGSDPCCCCRLGDDLSQGVRDLVIVISRDVREALRRPVLVVSDSGGHRVTFDLSAQVPTPTAGSTYRVRVGPGVPVDAQQAWIDFAISLPGGATGSARSEVLLRTR